jgi:hypothetical protein
MDDRLQLFGSQEEIGYLDDDTMDVHRSLSPANSAEDFFLSPDLRTNTISAYALAAQLRSSRGLTTVATDEFQSAVEEEIHVPRRTTVEKESLFGRDILVHSRCSFPAFDDDDEEDEGEGEEENDKVNPFESKTLVTHTDIEQTMSTSTTENQVNVAQVVYGKAKDIWSWGKGIPVVGFFEGVTESVATNVISIAGVSLSDIDNAVKDVVTGLDISFLNPAIATVVTAILNGVGKADDTFRPMIEYVGPTIMSPLKIITPKKPDVGVDDSSSPEHTPVNTD